MEKVIGISACLVGEKCRYDGKIIQIGKLNKILTSIFFIPVCPEILGGLSVPREIAEIFGGDGQDVIEGRAKVIDKNGNDLTLYFIKGAEETLKILKEKGINLVVFKRKSPSCGKGEIYDGTFSKKLKKGNGVTTALLLKNNIKVVNEKEFLRMKL